MLRKRPCRVCGRWFRPTPRAGDRQKVCRTESCQRERHRRSCAAWRAKNPDYDRSERLRRALTPAEPPPPRGLDSPPLRGLPLSAARDAVGWQTLVLTEEISRHLHLWARDAVRAELSGIHQESRRHLPSGRETESEPGSGRVRLTGSARGAPPG